MADVSVANAKSSTLGRRASMARQAAAQIGDLLDVVLERDETGDAEIIAMLDRSNRLAIAILELLDDAGGPSSEELENLRKMIYNGMRC